MYFYAMDIFGNQNSLVTNFLNNFFLVPRKKVIQHEHV